MTTPFISLENAPFFENVLLMEAKDTTYESLYMKILNFSTCMTSKDIAFLTVLFTYKISKLQQIIGGAEAPQPPPPASDGPD